MPLSYRIHSEGNFELQFDAEWSIIKVDNHKYYSRISGRGLKAVDYMAVHQDAGVALIELKDYSHSRAVVPSDLQYVMQRKKEDTLRLIKIVNSYLNRQLWYRIVSWTGYHRFMPDDWQVWADAAHHISKENYFFVAVVDL